MTRNVARVVALSVLLTAVGAIGFGGLAEAAEATKARVAVFEMRTDPLLQVSSAQTVYFTDLIRRAALVALPQSEFLVMDRENLDVLLTPEERAGVVQDDSGGDVAVGRKMKADYVAVAEMIRFDPGIRVTLNVYEVVTGAPLPSQVVSCAEVAQVEAKLPRAAEMLFGEVLKRRPRTKLALDPFSSSGDAWATADRFHGAAETADVFFDAKTGLEWMVGPDRDTAFEEAGRWIEGLNAADSGWRMPSATELAGLYGKGLGPRNLPPDFKTNGWYVWGNEVKGSTSASAFDYMTGKKSWRTRSIGANCRAFAVRARR
jgi:hypothetical protein